MIFIPDGVAASAAGVQGAALRRRPQSSKELWLPSSLVLCYHDLSPVLLFSIYILL